MFSPGPSLTNTDFGTRLAGGITTEHIRSAVVMDEKTTDQDTLFYYILPTWSRMEQNDKKNTAILGKLSS